MKKNKYILYENIVNKIAQFMIDCVKEIKCL